MVVITADCASMLRRRPFYDYRSSPKRPALTPFPLLRHVVLEGLIAVEIGIDQ